MKRKKEYAKLRKEFLEDYPYCEWFLAENGLTFVDALEKNGFGIPRATEIHHKRGRTGERLNDRTYWMAVSREGHLAIHQNPIDSYAKGYMVKR